MIARRSVLAAGLAAVAHRARAQAVVQDGAGRAVTLPGRVARVMPAGPPAQLLLWSLAPELMTGWVRPPSPPALPFLADAAATLPVSGRLTGRGGGDAAIAAVRTQVPDLVVDYGSLGLDYAALADRIQVETGCPALLLDGALPRIPDGFALLGTVLDRKDAGMARAAAARAILDAAERGAASLRSRGRPSVHVMQDGSGMAPMAAETLAFCGAQPAGPDQADWIIGPTSPAIAQARADPAWAGYPAVKARRVVRAPALPFGWLDDPPSVNRLAGLLWLPVLFGVGPAAGLPEGIADLLAWLYGRRPSPEQLTALLQDALPRWT